MKSSYDVIIFGGGTAGVTAAVQAGRSGADTLLVEKNGILGGTMTVGGINAPAHFFAWGRQVIGGIGWELMRRTWGTCGEAVPDGSYSSGTPGPKHLTMDKNIFAAVCDEVIEESGTDILFHAMPASLSYSGLGWDVGICTKTGLLPLRAKIIIDATGDANAAAIAGFPLIRPETVQPATMQLLLSGYDPDRLDYRRLKKEAERAAAEGRLKSTDVSWFNDGPEAFLRGRGNNGNHIRAYGAESSEAKTKVEIEARKSVLRMYRFFKAQPGLEDLVISEMAVETGIRETVMIKGKYTMTVDEYEAGRVYDDAVCYAFYPIDEHLNDGKGINYRFLENNIVPTISFKAMLPAGSRAFITAGRCISSDRETNAAIRVECPCMAMGQAAGAAAALSASAGVDPEELDIGTLRAELKRYGAIVPA